jgi:hypothetical protein
VATIVHWGRHEFDGSNALTWLFVGGFVALLAATAVLYQRMQAQLERSTRQG